MYAFMNIQNGTLLPNASGYADQPKIVVADDGTWVYAITTASGKEGAKDTFVGISLSKDEGKTWSDLYRLEESVKESSYASLFKAPSGRIFCFYNYNIEGFKTSDPITESDGSITHIFRCDMGMGIYCFQYSDDHGQTWSKKYYEIPIRDFEMDLRNRTYVRGKECRYFWNVSNPFAYDGGFYQPISKMMYYQGGLGYRSEGALLYSPNLCSEPDPEKIRWETLPEGMIGIRNLEDRKISEEHSCVALSDGTFYDVFRNNDGFIGMSISRDQGRTWSESERLTLCDGSVAQNPRANCPIWKCRNGNYILWFHNHNRCEYGQRNPAWISAGKEVDTPQGKTLRWSMPVVLFFGKPDESISYPEFWETEDGYYFAETQKRTSRFHQVPNAFMQELFDSI